MKALFRNKTASFRSSRSSRNNSDFVDLLDGDQTYPFSNIGSPHFRCPYWLKLLLSSRLSIEGNLSDIILELNSRMPEKLAPSLVQDIALEPFSDAQAAEAQRGGSLRFVVSTDADDEFIFYLSKDTDILTLKRLLLNKKKKPFWMELNPDNQSTIGEVFGERMSCSITYQIEKFDILVKSQFKLFESEDLVVSALHPNSTLDEIEVDLKTQLFIHDRLRIFLRPEDPLLDTMTPLKDLGITRFSDLKFSNWAVLLELADGQHFHLPMTKDEMSITELKRELQDFNLPPSKLPLFCEFLTESGTQPEVIRPGMLLSCTDLETENKVGFWIRNKDAERFEVVCSPNLQLSELFNIVSKLTKAYEVRLSLDGKALNDLNSTLDVLGITRECTLELDSYSTIEIKAKMDDHVLDLYVQWNEPIKSLKMLIFQQAGKPPEEQLLLFHGKVLREGSTILDYNLLEGSEIEVQTSLNEHFESSMLTITVILEPEAFPGMPELETFYLEASIMAKQLKEIIFNRIKVPPAFQILKASGKETVLREKAMVAASYAQPFFHLAFQPCIQLRLMGWKEALWVAIEQDTEVGDLLLNLGPHSLQLPLDTFEYHVENSLVAIYDGLFLDFKAVISKAMKYGHVLHIEFRLNLPKDLEAVSETRSEATAMMAYFAEQKQDGSEGLLKKSLCKELGKLGKKHKEWQYLKHLFEDPACSVEKAASCAFSSEAFSLRLGQEVLNKNYVAISSTMETLLHWMPEYEGSTVVYRGVRCQYVDLADYPLHCLRYWPGLTQCSASEEYALAKSRFSSHQNMGAIFKIHLANSTAARSIKHSLYMNRDGIVLPPGFAFIVGNTTELDNVTTIELFEVPQQSLALAGPFVQRRVVQIDLNVNSDENRACREHFQKELSKANQEFRAVVSLDEAAHLLRTAAKSVLITSGSLGKEVVPRLEQIGGLQGILVFCLDVEGHSVWAKEYKKIRGVKSQPKDVIKLVKECLKK